MHATGLGCLLVQTTKAVTACLLKKTMEMNKRDGIETGLRFFHMDFNATMKYMNQAAAIRGAGIQIAGTTGLH